MPGIIDFLTDVGGDRDLSGQFVSLIASPDCTQQDLMDFFKANHYGDVTPADVGKIMLGFGGGGHEAVGTCQVENDRAETTLKEIIAQINNDG